MPTSSEQLYQDHLELLEKCVHAHVELFPKTSQQAASALDVIKAAKKPAKLLSPEQQLVHTAKKSLTALDVKKPSETDLALRDQSDHDRAVEYATSPITQEFVSNHKSIKAAFDLQRNPNQAPSVRPQLQARFASPEHKQLGDALRFTSIDSHGNLIKTPRGECLFHMSSERHRSVIKNDELTLTAGDIIFLSGDFYGLPDTPIADVNDPNAPVSDAVRDRFLRAFDSLSAQSNNKTISKIKHILASTYSSNHFLNEYIQQLQLLLIMPKYGTLLYNNLDHFAPWSQQTYAAGHRIAMETAVLAQNEYAQGNFEQANALLQQAYQYDLYAQHFLSDNFAAGHIRIGHLRTKLRDEFGLIGSALINDMHNDDGDHGVWVCVNGKKVQLFGDGHLDDQPEKAALAMTEQAMQVSITELNDVFVSGKVPSKSIVEHYYPQVVDTKDRTVRQNAPLFQIENDRVMYRSPINELNPDKVEYKPLTPFKAFVILIARRIFALDAKYTPGRDHKESISEHPSPISTGKALQS